MLNRSAHSPTATIPILRLGEVYDQRYAQDDFHCDAHGRLSDFFGRNVPIHRHDLFFQIHFIRNGKVSLYLDDQQYQLQAPICFITPPGVPHAFHTDAQSEGDVITVRQQKIWQLFIDEPHLTARLGRAHCLSFTAPMQKTGQVPVPNQGAQAQTVEALRFLFGQLAQEAQARNDGREGNLMALLRLILVRLLRTTEHPASIPIPPQELTLFHHFSQLIEIHSQEHWQLQRYASALGLSTARLNRICRRMAGMSPHQLIAERQLQEARRLLIHSAQSVSQIAFSLGFEDPAYFSRFFRQSEGLSPKKFREHTTPPQSACIQA